MTDCKFNPEWTTREFLLANGFAPELIEILLKQPKLFGLIGFNDYLAKKYQEARAANG